MAAGLRSYSAIHSGIRVSFSQSVAFIPVYDIQRLRRFRGFDFRRRSIRRHSSDSPAPTHFLVTSLHSGACSGAVLLRLLVYRRSFPRRTMKHRESNERIEPMTSSAVTMHFQTRVWGALLVMAHPRRSAAAG